MSTLAVHDHGVAHHDDDHGQHHHNATFLNTYIFSRITK
jgi:cytochrome c oxidase subunit 1